MKGVSMRSSTANIIIWTLATVIIAVLVAEIVNLDYYPLGNINTEIDTPDIIQNFRISYRTMKSDLVKTIMNFIP